MDDLQIVKCSAYEWSNESSFFLDVMPFGDEWACAYAAQYMAPRYFINVGDEYLFFSSVHSYDQVLSFLAAAGVHCRGVEIEQKKEVQL